MLIIYTNLVVLNIEYVPLEGYCANFLSKQMLIDGIILWSLD